MAKGQVDVKVVKTNDDKFLLQVPQADPINRQVDVNITVHDTVDDLLVTLKPKLLRNLQ